MNRGKFIRRLAAALFLSAPLLPRAAMACTACAGRSDEAMARGMNLGIFALLVVIVSVLVGLASFAIFLARRAARYPLPSASSASLSDVEPDLPAEADAPFDQTISQPTK